MIATITTKKVRSFDMIFVFDFWIYGLNNAFDWTGATVLCVWTEIVIFIAINIQKSECFSIATLLEDLIELEVLSTVIYWTVWLMPYIHVYRTPELTKLSVYTVYL